MFNLRPTRALIQRPQQRAYTNSALKAIATNGYILGGALLASAGGGYIYITKDKSKADHARTTLSETEKAAQHKLSEAERTGQHIIDKAEYADERMRSAAHNANNKMIGMKNDAYDKGEELWNKGQRQVNETKEVVADKVESIQDAAYQKKEEAADEARYLKKKGSEKIDAVKDAAYQKKEEAKDEAQYLKEKGSEVIGSVGDRIKQTAQSAEEAAAGAYDNIKSEVSQVRDEADKFRSKHHLKEGEISPERVVSGTHQATPYGTTTVHRDGESRTTGSPTLWTKMTRTTDSINHNPMVAEKSTSQATKQDWEVDMERDAKYDNTSLVEKDTHKVRVIWDAKKGNLPERTEKAAESRRFWDVMFGRGNSDHEPGTLTNYEAFQRDDHERKNGLKSAWEDSREFVGQIKDNVEDKIENVKHKTKEVVNGSHPGKVPAEELVQHKNI